MQKVLTAEQMREVDRLTTEKYGIPSILLMENAAHAVARVITEKLGGSVNGRRILIVCGKGNNGGDGAALARILSEHGAILEVNILGEISQLSGDARTNFDRLRESASDDCGSKGNLYLEETPLLDYWVHTTKVENFDLIVDAIFGTGLTRPLDSLYSLVPDVFAGHFSESKPIVVSIDVPSGLFSDSSMEPELHLTADATVTFTSPKPANIMPPASNFNGELIISDIGSPEELIEEQSSQLFLAGKKDAEKWLEDTKFSDASYKNKRGHALIIAGSESYSGAAVLAGDAAMRSGVGLVTVVTPESSTDSVATRILPEVMVRGVAETENGVISEAAFDEIGKLLSKADSVAIGCGLSQNESTRAFIKKIIENRRQPTIVDADALNLLSPFAESVSSPHVSKGSTTAAASSGSTNWPPADLILTPHEGEFLRLLGTEDKDAIKDRVAAVRGFAVKNNVILVLKGERVLIGEPGGKVVVNPTGNSGLGKAGNGDTLTGILSGFVAQAAAMNIDIFETVVAAVYVAGMAGDIAEKKYGKRVMTASDVRECLTEVFEQLAGN